MLSLPLNREETVFINSSLWGREETSQTEPVTWYPLAFHSFKHSSSRVWSLAHAWTLAPKPASSSTIAYLKLQNQIPQAFMHVSTLLCVLRWKLRNRAFWSKKTNPIPLVPPVTRAVIPRRLHRLSIVKYQSEYVRKRKEKEVIRSVSSIYETCGWKFV